ncbi:alpha/beta-hydrolase [Aureobasidium sp. EXF-12298]|nr:alpha/beta-hydrolase [Aureobasidium sp. EXF-12298]KAI4754942.1 alpha/beta-hydrolase [Aureobasidium sp. EXF-12344]KAI4772035.1 alpha/beta-hydrolase [Aureobasidium sp. EXF-3400]
MTSTEKPVIVIVPGAWHVPAHYAYLALKLNANGYTVDCIESSSTNDERDLPEDTWKEDISIIRNAITSHTEAGRDVALVMHSFGGMAGSEAACGLGKKSSETSGSIIKLVYLAAFMMKEGESPVDFDWPRIAVPDDEQNPKAIYVPDPISNLYHDVPEQMSQRAVDNLGGHPIAHAFSRPSKVAWREIPTAYIMCEDDRALPIGPQEQMINAVKAEGVHVETTSLKSSHSPFLSMPAETAKVIRGFLEKA